MRAYDLIYRLGGDEILVLLPGADLDETAALAEDLQRSIDVQSPDGGSVTVSLGVGASPRDEAFDFQRVSREADAALYEAKKQGRGCVRVATVTDMPAPAPAKGSLTASRAAA
jgi:diguanylate cyclase (GGDEF)-like protein